MDSLEVYWNGALVGAMESPVPDMWYLEGVWRAAPESAAADFVQAASSLDVKAVMADWEKGILVELHEAEGRIPAIVMAPVGPTMFVRRISQESLSLLIRRKT